MPGYHRNPNWSWEDSAADGIAGLILLMMIIVAALVATLLIILATEVVRIYKAHALAPTETARLLWIAAAAQVGFWAVAGLLLTTPATVPLGAYLAAWSALVFVIAIEVLDQKHQPAKAPAGDPIEIDDVLVRPWANPAA
jgi:hypothetical protein